MASNQRAERRHPSMSPVTVDTPPHIPRKERARLVIEQMDEGYVASLTELMFAGGEQLILSISTVACEDGAKVRDIVANFLAKTSQLNPSGGAVVTLRPPE